MKFQNTYNNRILLVETNIRTIVIVQGFIAILLEFVDNVQGFSGKKSGTLEKVKYMIERKLCTLKGKPCTIEGKLIFPDTAPILIYYKSIN